MAKSNSWLANKSYSSTNLTDNLYAYYKAKSGLSTVSLNDHQMKVLTTLGYTTGSLNDRLYAFYKAKTGLSGTPSFGDLENAFFANNTYDFN